MKTGKLEPEFLQSLLKKPSFPDRRVIVGPKAGEDAAVLDPGEDSPVYWIVTADPITFPTDEIGYYGVVINLNDIATRGGVPRWFVATLLFPERGTDEKRVREVFRRLHQACRRFRVSLIGGHTEVTSGIDRVLLSGTMIGEVPKEKLVTTSGVRAGDALVLIKGICIEGTSILAREREKELLRRGVPRPLVRRAKNFLFDPGLDVFQASRIAREAVSVHAMHDPTEGGLINGICEMAMASQKEMEVDLQRVLVYEESRVLCETFGLNPFRVIASGALLLTVSPEDLPSLSRVLGKTSMPMQVIGKAKNGPARVLTRKGRRMVELAALARDELLRIDESGGVG